MSVLEIIRQALFNLKNNKLRSLLTLSIIAFGIMALVGILTSIDTAITSLGSNFSSIGANTFEIQPGGEGMTGNRRGRRLASPDAIGVNEALAFKDRFDFPSKVSITYPGASNATVKYRNEKSNPTIQVSGIDEHFLDVKAYDLVNGRNYTGQEIKGAYYKAIIGNGIVKLLFNGNAEKALNQDITINGYRFMVSGVLKEKGSTMSFSGDNRVLIPFELARRHFGQKNVNIPIYIQVVQSDDLPDAEVASIGLMRAVRKLKIQDPANFHIEKSDGLVRSLKENTANLRAAAVAIGIITLLGAAIGLMNIMLVSVTERTREIGIMKALGATKKNILIQFITEAMVICQIGGLVGIVLGILMGNLLTIFFDSAFLIPWAWITLGVVTCVVVGPIAGFYPAMKAANLDPVDSLRYE